MKTFNAIQISDTLIELTSSGDLEDLYNVIKDDENFILKWEENKVQMSKIIIANALLPKVENGEIEISARGE